MVAVVGICIYIQDRDSINSVKFIVDADNGVKQSVDLYYNDGKHYAFLPSYADFDSLKIKYNAASLYLDGKRYNSNSLLSEIVTDKEYYLELKNSLGISVYKSKLVFMKGEHIPSFFISLVDGTIDEVNSDKSVSKTGYATMIEASGNIDYEGTFKKIHGRGNTTWGEIKKPYSIEFSENTSLLNMGSGKSYCLLANACDNSNLRNKMVLDAAKEYGVSNALQSAFVDLYIDNEYMGLYLLTESIEIGEDRINIEDLESKTQKGALKSLSNYNSEILDNEGMITKSWDIPIISDNTTDYITGGYILEIDEKSRMNNEKSYFILPDDTSFCIKSPKFSTNSQVEYISGLINRIIRDLDSSTINTSVDFDSWLNYYLIQEGFANTDIFSLYFTKDSDCFDNKVYAGPIWDFDFSMGSCFLGKDASPTVFYVNTNGVFGKLYKINDFQEAVKNRYKQSFRSILVEYSRKRLNEYKYYIEKSFAMNRERWRGIQEYEWCNQYNTFQEHIDYLSSCLIKRIEFLDDAWINGNDYCRIYYKSDGPLLYEKHFYSVKKGEVFGEIPEPICDGYKFLGYYDYKTNELYDPKSPITESKFLIAKWEKLSNYSQNSISIKERITMKINDERLYMFLGSDIIVLVVLVIVFIDLRRLIKRRRNKNGNKS